MAHPGQSGDEPQSRVLVVGAPEFVNLHRVEKPRLNHTLVRGRRSLMDGRARLQVSGDAPVTEW